MKRMKKRRFSNTWCQKTMYYGYGFLKECGKNPWAMGLAFKKLKATSQRKDRSKYKMLCII